MFAMTNSNVHVIEDSVSRVNFGDTNIYVRTLRLLLRCHAYG